MHNIIKKIDPLHPEPDIITQGADIIRQGGLVLFPTQCLYGLGADALNPDAVERIFSIKERSDKKPILILIAHQNELEQWVKDVPPVALFIMEKFWPGNITLIFKAKENLPKNLMAGTGKIGIRLSQHPVASALIKAVGGPITGTSANLSGKRGISEVSDLDPQIADNLDMILDAGSLKGGIGSTVIDVTAEIPVVLREGSIPGEKIFAFVDKSERNFVDKFG